MIVAGVDGTKKGWVVITFDGRDVGAFAAATIEIVAARLPDAAAVAVDMPIGFLTAAVPGGRLCEQSARARLKGRSSCVFSSPVRAALEALTPSDARRANRYSSVHTKDLSAQSLGLFRKMREVDQYLGTDVSRQDRVFETHPEVAFALMAERRGLPTPPPKTWFTGMKQRLAMLQVEGLAVESFLADPRLLGAADNDILDAAACAWTAWRRAEGQAERLPPDPPTDARGLRMEIWV